MQQQQHFTKHTSALFPAELENMFNCKATVLFTSVYNIGVYVIILIPMQLPAHPRLSGRRTGKRWFVLEEEVQRVCVFVSVWACARLRGGAAAARPGSQP